MDNSELAEHPKPASHEHHSTSEDQERLCNPDQLDRIQESGDPCQSDHPQESSEANLGDDKDITLDHSNIDCARPR